MENYNCVNCNELVVVDGMLEELIENKLCDICFIEKVTKCSLCGEYVVNEETKEYYDLKNDRLISICDGCNDEGYNTIYCEHHGRYEYLGNSHSSYDITDFGTICEDAYWEGGFTYCEHCDEHYVMEGTQSVATAYNNDYITLCGSCMEDDETTIYCEYHNRIEYVGDATIYNLSDTENICVVAYSEGNFDRCPICGDIFRYEDMQFCSDRDEYLCDSCYEEYEENQIIKGYHNHKDDYEYNMKLASLDGDSSLTYGFELEVESGRICTIDMAHRLSEISDFTVYENDGSLKDGFEIISLPFDTEYLMLEGKKIIKNILVSLNENGYKSHDTSTCGLHFHVGIKGLGSSYHGRNLVIQRIGCILEYFKEELTVLTRRTDEKLNRWSKFVSKDYTKEELDIDKISHLIEDRSERYSALNLENDNTIEFRLFRGTLKYETFMATWELVHNIVKYAKENTFNDLTELDYKTIFTYDKCDYIKDYMSKHKLLGEVLAK